MMAGSLIVQGLYVYPVKSCAGVDLREAAVEKLGFKHDRRWMVVDEAWEFLTQRTEPRLALVRVNVEGDALVLEALEAPGMERLRVPVPERGAASVRARVWKDQVNAVDCGPEAAAWFSRWLGRTARLVTVGDDFIRPVNPKHARPGDFVGFADGFPLLVATTASLADLNARLEQPVPMDRFRPNIVIDGADAWAEDAWKRIRIGGLTMRVAKPCARCVITTTDQKTAARGVEPLRTLATFRAVPKARPAMGEGGAPPNPGTADADAPSGNDVMFGQNAIPDGEGIVRVGDAVTVLEGA
jgi:uncharacterized protein YcbX